MGDIIFGNGVIVTGVELDVETGASVMGAVNGAGADWGVGEHAIRNISKTRA